MIVEWFHNSSNSYQYAHLRVGNLQGGMWYTHVGMVKSNAVKQIG